MKKIVLIIALMLCSQSCVTTINTARMTAAVSKSQVEACDRAGILFQSILLTPVCVVADVLMFPWEIYNYGIDRADVTRIWGWDFSDTWNHGYDTVPQYYEEEDD
jgi:hypothetical protein